MAFTRDDGGAVFEGIVSVGVKGYIGYEAGAVSLNELVETVVARILGRL